jgi:secondary thiamine-phosphate synthase enzyme
MRLHCDTVTVRHGVGPDIVDITPHLGNALNASGIARGTLSAFVVGSTGSLTTIEYEPGVVQDLTEAVIRLAPPDMPYAHELAWHDGNGHSHVQAALLQPHICLPVREYALRLGTWQQVVAINHDNRARQRVIEVTIMGTEH